MRRTLPLVLLVSLVLLSGCSVLEADPAERLPNDTNLGDTGGTETTDPRTTGSPGGSATVTATPTPTVANPWNTQTVTVAVEANASDSLARATRTAVDYWNTDGAEYATYPVTFQYVTTPENADILVRPVAYPLDCGHTVTPDTIGCAPILDADSTAPNEVTVRVIDGIPHPSARATVKHELGHVVGLYHDDEPSSLMSYNDTLTAHQQRVIEDADASQLARRIEMRLNDHRREYGEDRLVSDEALRTKAQARAESLADRTDASDGSVVVDPDLGLTCEIDLGGRRYLPEGDADLHWVSLFRYQGTEVGDPASADYVGGPAEGVETVVSEWRIGNDVDRAEHYNRHGVGVHISESGKFVAVRAIC